MSKRYVSLRPTHTYRRFKYNINPNRKIKKKNGSVLVKIIEIIKDLKVRSRFLYENR